MRLLSNLGTFTESLEESWSIQGEKLKSTLSDAKPRRIERFYPNEYYGIDLIIKYLLSVDPNKSLPFGLPHAVCFGYQEGWYVYGRREKVKTLVHHNNLDLRVMHARKCKGWVARLENTFSILLKMLLNSNHFESFYSPNKSRLLYFPVHTNSEWKLKNELHDHHLIELLREKSGDYELVDVMLPLDSIVAGRGVLFQEAGFKVISAGSIWDPRFLCRWMNLVSNYGTISTSHLGSHLFYGLLMKREVVWLSSEKLATPRKIDYLGNLRPVMEPFPETIALVDKLKKPKTKLNFDSEFWFGSRLEQDLLTAVENLEKVYKKSLKYKYCPFRPSLREVNILDTNMRASNEIDS